MYYLLKANTFYLPLEDGGIFFKNGEGTVAIHNKNGFMILKKIEPALNGKIDLDDQISKIENKVVKDYIYSLIDVLKDKGYLLYSENEINLGELSDYEKSLVYYCKSYDMIKEISKQETNIVVLSANKRVNKKIADVLSDGWAFVKTENNYKEYIEVSVNSDEVQESFYVYVCDDKIIVSKDVPDRVERCDIPLHLWAVVAAIIRIELVLRSIGNENSVDFEKQDYQFDVRLLSGEVVKRGYKNGKTAICG